MSHFETNAAVYKYFTKGLTTQFFSLPFYFINIDQFNENINVS